MGPLRKKSTSMGDLRLDANETDSSQSFASNNDGKHSRKRQLPVLELPENAYNFGSIRSVDSYFSASAAPLGASRCGGAFFEPAEGNVPMDPHGLRPSFLNVPLPLDSRELSASASSNTLATRPKHHFRRNSSLKSPSFTLVPPTPNLSQASGALEHRSSLKHLYMLHRGQLSPSEQYRYR